MRAAPGAVLFRIADHQVGVGIGRHRRTDLGLISSDKRPLVRPRAYPNVVATGEVVLIYPHLNARRAPRACGSNCRIRMVGLRPDMYADVEIATGTDVPALTVSESAIIDSGGRQLVLLDQGEGRFETPHGQAWTARRRPGRDQGRSRRERQSGGHRQLPDRRRKQSQGQPCKVLEGGGKPQ